MSDPKPWMREAAGLIKEGIDLCSLTRKDVTEVIAKTYAPEAARLDQEKLNRDIEWLKAICAATKLPHCGAKDGSLTPITEQLRLWMKLEQARLDKALVDLAEEMLADRTKIPVMLKWANKVNALRRELFPLEETR